MKKIVYLRHFKCRETVAVLRYLLGIALRGEIDGMLLCFIRNNGKPEYAFTGKFKADCEAAFMAASRIAWKMNNVIDSKDQAS